MVDDPVTLRLAGDKPVVHAILAERGLPVPPHAQYTLDGLATAQAFLAGLGAA